MSAWEPPELPPYGGLGYADAEKLEARLEANAGKVADEGAEIARSVGFGATPLATNGSPVWRTIVDTAEEHDAGIIVMGSHGHTGIGLVLMGSVASTVVRHASAIRSCYTCGSCTRTSSMSYRRAVALSRWISAS